MCPKSNLFEPDVIQDHENPGIPPHWQPEIEHNTLSRALRPTSIEHVDSNSGERTSRGDHAEMTRQRLCCQRSSDEGREEGLIEVEVGGDAVEVGNEGFVMEWGMQAEGELWRIALRKGRGRSLRTLGQGSARRDAD